MKKSFETRARRFRFGAVLFAAITAGAIYSSWFFGKEQNLLLESVFEFLVLVGTVLGAGCGLGASLYADKANKIPGNKSLDTTVLTEVIKSVIAQVRERSESINQKYPGLSLHFLLNLKEVHKLRRKFVFDIGDVSKTRVSLYLDRGNNVCLRVIDQDGEISTAKTLVGSLPYRLGSTIYLAAEVGISGDSTFLSLTVDGVQLARQELPYQSELPSFDAGSGILGSDLNHKNGGYFDLAEVMFYSSTITTDEAVNLLRYFQAKEIHGWGVFSGKQFMVMDKKA